MKLEKITACVRLNKGVAASGDNTFVTTAEAKIRTAAIISNHMNILTFCRNMKELSLYFFRKNLSRKFILFSMAVSCVCSLIVRDKSYCQVKYCNQSFRPKIIMIINYLLTKYFFEIILNVNI